jgi:hypothetical protein
VFGINFASGPVSGGLNALARVSGFGRGYLRAEPPVGDPAYSLERFGATAAKPNLQWILNWAGSQRETRERPSV